MGRWCSSWARRTGESSRCVPSVPCPARVTPRRVAGVRERGGVARCRGAGLWGGCGGEVRCVRASRVAPVCCGPVSTAAKPLNPKHGLAVHACFQSVPTAASARTHARGRGPKTRRACSLRALCSVLCVLRPCGPLRMAMPAGARVLSVHAWALNAMPRSSSHPPFPRRARRRRAPPPAAHGRRPRPDGR